MEEFIQKDQETFLYLNNLGNPTFDQFWILISEKWLWIPLYIIFLYFLYKNYNKRLLIYILIFAAIGLLASDQIANIFKFGVARLRPCHDPNMETIMRVVRCGGDFGFYSAHASNSFFIATFLTILLRKNICICQFSFLFGQVLSPTVGYILEYIIL